MRFYQNSTTRGITQPPSENLSILTTTNPLPHLTDNLPHSLYIYYFNHYCSEFLSVSNYLNQQLLRNNQLISQTLIEQPHCGPPSDNGKKDSEDNSTASRNNASQFNFDRTQNQPQEESKISKVRIERRRKCLSEQESQYQPDDDYDRQAGSSKVSESKNIPKNYGKAIVNFIRKQDSFTMKVLKHLKIDFQDFFEYLNELRHNLNTIFQLRAIWVQGQNPYAKAFRILSIEYLRKHSLSYIFNSRVFNFHKHIKYRYKIIQSVGEPESFTCMKEF